MKSNPFSQALIRWQRHHGRHDLPWQKNTTAYRVWVSEIMLQQTQVTTVIPYYKRFMRSFPSVKSCAQATSDDILAHWSGLGYYTRARNLHKTAQIIHQQYSGRFPTTVEGLVALPGIGRSTAGAIISFSTQQHAVILDGNVKRVLSRYHRIVGWPGNKAIHDQLWQVATQMTPLKNSSTYNQALMDLGSLICTRSSPQCTSCPLQSECAAFITGEQNKFPGKKPKQKKRRKETTTLLILQKKNLEVLLLKRPDKGIWGGLWSFPEGSISELEKIWGHLIDSAPGETESLPPIEHSFSHYDLTINPVLVRLDKKITIPDIEHCWYQSRSPQSRGLPAPIKTLLDSIGANT